MKEFECWKNQVVQALAEKELTVPEPVLHEYDFLVRYWNSNYSVEDVLKIRTTYRLCNQRPEEFDSAERCGCFHCTKFFAPGDIDWDFGIAQCPYCHIDSVLPDTANFPLSKELLKWLCNKQFSSNAHI